MIELWLRGGAWAIVVGPVVVLGLVAAFIVWLTHRSPARPFFLSCVGVTGPFFGAVSILFGLFSAFLANDVHTRNGAIDAAVAQEADGLRTILRLAEASGPAGAPVTAAAAAYTRSVLERDFAALGQGRMGAEDLGALRSLTMAVLASGSGAALPVAVHEAMLQGLVEVRQARLQRLMLTAGDSDHMNWVAMLVLGFLTQVAVAVVHLERLRPQALALFVFTAAFAATVVLIGLAARPFSGTAIDDGPLRAALATAAP